jgi:hypothetical protein
MGNYRDYKRYWADQEWKSYNLTITKRFSCEGLVGLGSKLIKRPLEQIVIRFLTGRIKKAQRGVTAPMFINIATIEKETVVTNGREIKEAFKKVGKKGRKEARRMEQDRPDQTKLKAYLAAGLCKERE